MKKTVIIVLFVMVFAALLAVQVFGESTGSIILHGEESADGSTTFIEYLPGDVDGNGIINMHDVLILCQYYIDGCQYDPNGYGVTLSTGISHTVVTVAAKTPTCTEDGNIEYRYCTTCEKYFDDTEHKNEIPLSDTVIPANGHAEVIDKSVAATCTETGLTEGKHCSVCNEILVEQNIIPANGHNFVKNICTVCGEKKLSENLEFVSNGDGTCYVNSIGTCADTDIIIPTKSPVGDTVTSVAESAFYNCTALTSIEIPDSVQSIGKGALQGCDNLETLTIPFVGESRTASAYSGVLGYIFGYETKVYSPSLNSYWGQISFGYDIYDLSDIQSHGSLSYSGSYINQKVGNISNATWQYSCYSTSRSYLVQSGGMTTKSYYMLTSYHYYIPSSLKNVIVTSEKIPVAAFNNCTSLTSITLSYSVSTIENYSINGCTNLTSIVYNGTKSQWNAIDKGSNWNTSTGNYTVYCTDGNITK